MNALTVATAATRSSFVTVLAWVFIVLAGFSTFIALMQNVMVNLLFPIEEMRATAQKASPELPWITRLMAEYTRSVFAALLALWVFVLVAAIALLKRKNWARIAFMVLLGLGIAVNVVGLLYFVPMFNELTDLPSNAPAHVRAEWQRFNLFFSISMGVLQIGVSVLFGWLIWKLQSRSVAAEFRAG